VFDVLTNGRPVVEKLDVAAAGGGVLTAVTRRFDAGVTDDTLVLEFRPIRGRAIVSAIEIEASR
jgi:beta-galactosidase